MNQIKELSARLETLERKSLLKSGGGNLKAFKTQSVIGKFTSEEFSHKLGSISICDSGEVLVQVTLNITSEVDGEVALLLSAGDMILYSGRRKVSAGENEIYIMNTFSGATGSEAEITITINSEELSHYVKGASLYLLSSGVLVSGSEKLSISADKAENSIIVCYLIDGKIYALNKQENLTEIDFDEFSYYADAKVVDCVICTNDAVETPCIFRLTSDGNIYYSFGQNVQDERICVPAGGVTNFTVATFENRQGILVCYIKDGFPYYKTIQGGNISLESEFPANKSKKYTSVCALKSSSSGTTVIATTTKNANFLFELAPDLNYGSGDKLYCSAVITYY